MIKVKRTDKESGERLIQRFSNKVKASRIVVLVKSKQFLKKDLTRSKRRQAALMREFYRAKREREKYYS